jgi:hypothetical protein
MFKTRTVIDVSFVLEPGEKYEPYENGTYYHTVVFTKSVLLGEVLVEGEEIYFTANGYNTRELENVYIDQNLNFTIDPANDLYTFTFDNTKGSAESYVMFSLTERWINIFQLILGLLSLSIFTSAGVIILLRSRRKQLPSDMKKNADTIKTKYLNVLFRRTIE